MSYTPFNQDDWGQYARCYDSLCVLTPYQNLLNRVCSHIDATAEKHLDVGCGTGNLLEKIAARLPQVNSHGIDGASAMVQRAAMKVPNAHLVVADLNEPLAIETQSVDVVTSTNVLYALQDPDVFLHEIHRILRRTGTLILVNPKPGYQSGQVLKAHCQSTKPDSFWNDVHASPEKEAACIMEALGNIPEAAEMNIVAEHNRAIVKTSTFHFFTAEELTDKLVRLGFVIHEVEEVYANQGILVKAGRT